ncbi:hypothetical protein [Nannocystis punicea]|uniref:Tetratricopeptide repeat-containing protein n=1 Tax=Nannocystis punicea TaxID=2995304 RepID=A0ABY7HJJ9_9BACT|nr:hypothetical protein [Nannocystis poenicansa]WAS99479.1 hypothetical protein O0S08_25420 [Nannocystis poenicansa]
MLRLTLHLVLAANFAVSPVAGPKDKPASNCRNPSALYEEGLKDYDQKFTKAAIEKFEAAHKCSKNPLILYNIGLAYKRLYDAEQQPELLHAAKTALVEYVDAIEKDPTLGADPEEVKPVLAEIDAEIERIRPPEVEPEPEPPPPAPEPVDPGKSRRMLGIGLMSGGGALTVVGVAVSAAFASKGARLHDQLNGEGGVYDQLEMGGCGLSPMDDGPDADTMICDGLRGKREDLKADGVRANGVAFGMMAVGVVGLGLIIGGAVAFAQGKRATAEWETSQRARVRVLPTMGGLLLQGRF